MTGTKQSHARVIAKSLMLVSVAWTGGATDAICYGGLGHVFAANMTGHTVLVALSLSGAAGLSITRSCIALAAFLFGVFIGAWVAKIAVGSRKTIRSLIWAVVIEAVVLLAFAAAWFFFAARTDWQVAILISLSGLAMGIQSAAVRNLELTGIATTYITGLYTQLVSVLVQRGSNTTVKSVAEIRSHGDDYCPSFNLGLPIAVLITYGLGAVAGGWSLVGIPAFAPAMSLVGLAGVALTVSFVSLPDEP